jgi:aminotransferase
MKTKIAQCVQDIVPSVIRQMSIMASKYENVISLGIGEPDFDTPAEICDAALNDARSGHTHYTASRGDSALLGALVDMIKTRFGISLEESQLVVTHGGMGGLNGFMRSVVESGQQVVVPEPHFPTYKAQIRFADGEIVYVPTRFEKDFILQPEDVEKALTPQSKVLVLNSPNNPTGSVIPDSVLDDLAELAISRDLLVLSDEVYDRLVYGKPHTSIYTRPGMAERTVVVNSFSKAYAMTGWRMGYAYGPAWLIDEMLKVVTFQTSCASSVGQRAALAALKADAAKFDAMAKEFEDRCGYVYQRLSQMPGVDVKRTEGSFYVFPRIAAIISDCEQFAFDLLDQEQVVVVPGSAFGPSGKGFVRIACTVGKEKLVDAMDRFERFVRRHHS